MIMEHFELHKEQLEDLIVDIQKQGPKVLMDLPSKEPDYKLTLNDFALIDELSGLNNFLENHLKNHNIPEHIRDRIRARMYVYDGEKPKEIALNELRMSIFGSGR